ncbi:ABC transporter permease subunit, partial [Klebsiella pneumoniae]|uniref:ABC transporter permease subunit n=1 Tax=Klebsiella pneumoniae TaxID=573 RepID=UPI003EDF8E2A
MACAVVALKFPGPLGVVLGIVTAIVAGAVWALPAGLIKAYRNGHEVITTIMLNNVALFFTSALVSGPIKDPGSADTSTVMVSAATRI